MTDSSVILKSNFILVYHGEHLRYHERFTKTDKGIEDRVLTFHIGNGAPVVNHFASTIGDDKWS